MKRTLLLTLAALLLATGAAVAQTSTTSAPGPSLQREPGMTNNNLPNPGNPQTQVNRQPTTTAEETTADTSGTMDSMDHDTMEPTTAPTAESTGAMDSTPQDTATDDSMSADTAGTTGTGADAGATLPATGSDLPLLGLAGLAALGVAAGLRRIHG